MRKYWLLLSLFTLAAQMAALLPSAEYERRPEMFALIYRPLEVTAADGSPVACWFFPAQPMPTREAILAAQGEGVQPAYTPSAEPAPTIVVANGDAGNMGNQINFVVGFCPLGYNVALFDWRGFGASGAWSTDRDRLAYTEYLLDYAAVLNSVFARPEVDTTRVAVYGGSTGAYLSLAAASRDPRVSVCVLRALLTRFDDVLPILHAAKPDRDIKAPRGYPPELEPLALAPGFTRPVLLIVGENDEVTPLWMSEELLAAFAGPKELWVVHGATHGGAEGPVYSDFDRFTQRVDAFLRQTWQK